MISLEELEKTIGQEYLSDGKSPQLMDIDISNVPSIEQLLQKAPQPHTNKVVSL